MTIYRIEHSDPDVYCVEAYGCDYHPVFTDATNAQEFAEQCIASWPAGSPARRMYRIEEYESIEAAMADGQGNEL